MSSSVICVVHLYVYVVFTCCVTCMFNCRTFMWCLSVVFTYWTFKLTCSHFI